MSYETVERQGLLVAFEGPDGSGKTTQRNLLKDWLVSRHELPCVTKWNSSQRFKSVIRERKAERSLTPENYATLQAMDFRERFSSHILPALSTGQTVLADRYVFSGVARDVSRGLDRNWSLSLYEPVRWPDLIFYFNASVETCVERTTSTGLPGYYKAGQDVTGVADCVESYRLFTERVVAEYASLSQQFFFVIVDAEKDIYIQHEFIRNIYEARKALTAPAVVEARVADLCTVS